MQVDHLDPAQVQALEARMDRERAASAAVYLGLGDEGMACRAACADDRIALIASLQRIVARKCIVRVCVAVRVLTKKEVPRIIRGAPIRRKESTR